MILVPKRKTDVAEPRTDVAVEYHGSLARRPGGRVTRVPPKLPWFRPVTIRDRARGPVAEGIGPEFFVLEYKFTSIDGWLDATERDSRRWS